jgi:hypothetical protein
LQLVAKSYFEDPLNWWEAHEAQFPIVGYLAHQILSIVGS